MKRIALFVPVALITIACAPPDDPAEAGSSRVVREVFSEIWSKGNVELIPEYFSESFVGHFPGGDTVHGREGLAAEVMAHRKAFPDWTEVVEDVILDHNRIAVRFTSHGTNTGEFLGNPPTGSRVEISEVALFRLENGDRRAVGLSGHTQPAAPVECAFWKVKVETRPNSIADAVRSTVTARQPPGSVPPG